MRPRLVLAVLACGLLLAVPTSPAIASCDADTPRSLVSDAPVAFVGTVIDQRYSYARLDVEQVWRGPDLAPQVWVQGGTDPGPWPVRIVLRSASSTDIDWVRGDRYLVLGDGQFVTNGCMTWPVAELGQLGDLAPVAVRDPVPGGATGARPPVHDGVALALTTALVAGLTVLVRLRSP